MVPVLIIATAALAAHGQYVLGDCTTGTYGDLGGHPQPLPDVMLPPPNRAFDIAVPDMDGCIKVGVSMTCCDEEARPVVVLRNTNSATVMRTGATNLPARVLTTVFCLRTGSPAPPHDTPAPGWQHY